jgi:hypothetical protein
MREIECVRQDNKHDSYIKNLLKEIKLNPKFISWENSTISHFSPLIMVLEEEYMDAFLELCEIRDLKFIVALNARKDFKMIVQLKDHFDKIFGFIDLSQETDYNTPILLNYMNMNFSSKALSLDKLASDLNKVYEFTKSELMRVKDLHDRLVKMRVDTLKGVSVTSKFMAGEKSGGEFLDMIQTDNNFLYIQAGSDSYILSSLIISEMEILKLSTPTTTLKDQSMHFEKMINHHAKEMKAQLSYSIININLKTLQAECNFKGDGYIYYNNELLDYSKPLTLKLKPSEKFYLLSNGALKNLKELNPDLSIKSFYKNNADKNTREMVNEFFFEISKNKDSNFLNYDALMAVIEIDHKTLYKL